MKNFVTFAVAVVASGFFGQASYAGELSVMHPTVQAPVPGAKVAGGYLQIVNQSGEADRLIGIEADFAGKSEIHEMKMVEGVMQMRALKNGVEIPDGETVALERGGYHIMFMKVGEQLHPGKTRKVTLVFEKQGRREVDFSVKSLADTMNHSN